MTRYQKPQRLCFACGFLPVGPRRTALDPDSSTPEDPKHSVLPTQTLQAFLHFLTVVQQLWTGCTSRRVDHRVKAERPAEEPTGRPFSLSHPRFVQSCPFFVFLLFRLWRHVALMTADSSSGAAASDAPHERRPRKERKKKNLAADLRPGCLSSFFFLRRLWIMQKEKAAKGVELSGTQVKAGEGVVLTSAQWWRRSNRL